MGAGRSGVGSSIVCVGATTAEAIALGGYTWYGFTVGRALSVIGLGLDICGVWMLAHGILLSPEQLRHVGTWDMMGREARRRAVHDRAEGLVGVRLAVAGFMLQLASNLLPS